MELLMRLMRVQVEGLLGHFTHVVEFEDSQDFVILYGPNGIGKTRLLELINFTFKSRILAVDRVPFETATFDFEDGTVLSLSREGQGALFDGTGDDSVRDLVISLRIPSENEITWQMGRSRRQAPVSRILRLIEQEVPVTRVGPDEWHDMVHEEVISRDQLIDRYGSHLPPDMRPYELPEKMQAFFDGLESHLIETQRLLRDTPRPRGVSARSMERPAKSTVEVFSQNFSEQMGKVLAQNSRTSQERDRTFPRRLLSYGGVPAEATEEAIRLRYGQQSELRARLARIALLEQSSTDLPLPDRELEDWERLVLWTYLDDSQEKLANLQDFLERAELFTGIMNGRLEYKQLHVSREGFTVVSDYGQEIPVVSLSSGEQHELVLTYDLLFNVNRGALVLIDEPEISLHVAWQQEFMNDIANIANIASLRFIVATHSPQIIHKWWSRAVSLGPNVERGQ
ncbi:AAA family ATPase [Streptomyces albidoflavus]